jgi:hypothetical protein
MSPADAALAGRGAAGGDFDGAGGFFPNGMRTCGVTGCSGRNSPGGVALSSASRGVCSLGPGLTGAGAEAAGDGADALG